MSNFSLALLSCTRAGAKLVEIGSSLGPWILQETTGKPGMHIEDIGKHCLQ